MSYCKTFVTVFLLPAGLVIAGLGVLVDREQGGAKELRDAGYDFLAAFSLSVLLDCYVRAGSISQAKRDEVITYVAANR